MVTSQNPLIHALTSTSIGLTALAWLNLAVPPPAMASSFTAEESPLTTEEMLEMSVPLGKMDGLSDALDILSLIASLDNLLGDIEALSSTDIPVDLDALGIPDPSKFEQEIAQTFEDKSIEEIGLLDSVFGSRIGGQGSNSLPEDYYQDFLATLAQGTAEETALSQDAQQKTKESLELSAQATEESLTLAEDSQSQDVSQNILRNISAQIAQQQKVDGLVYQQLEQSKLTDAAQVQVMGESLKELSQNNTRSLRERIGSNKQAMNQIYLLSIPGSAADKD